MDRSFDLHKSISMKNNSDKTTATKEKIEGSEEGCVSCLVDGFPYLTCTALKTTPTQQEKKKKELAEVHRKQMKQRQKVKALRRRIQTVERNRGRPTSILILVK